jgi:apolipoprotein N-acyltransferase
LDLGLALLSGALLALSFPKFGHPAAAWIALAPLLLAVAHRRQSSRRAFFLGLTAGAVYFAGTLYWLVQTMTTFGGLSTPLAVLAAALLIAYLSLFPAAFAVVQARLFRAWGLPSLLFAPMTWVATEMGRTYILDGFPWELLGYSQATVLPIAQLASVFGVYGLSGFVAAVSAAAAFAALDRSNRRWRVVAAVAALVLGAGLWGALRIRASALTRSGSPIRVAVVQGNILQDDKWDPRMRAPILDRYVNMTREAIGRNAQFVLWPESSMPEPYEQDVAGGDVIRRLVTQSGITLLIGSDQVEPVKPIPLKKPPPPRLYNAAYLIQPDGRTAAVYRKIHLVPFGEYVPFSRLLFFVGPIVQAVSDFTPGTETSVLPVAGHEASTAICYEVIYSSLMRAFVTRGSELLTTITNDAWYGWSSAAYQHWEQASLRAVEEGRYLARAANTGISGFVDPYGRVLQRSNMFQSAVMEEELRFITERTIYSRIGDLVGWVSVALTLGAIVATRRTRYNDSRLMAHGLWKA